jgi:transcription elongation factor Elf1
LSIARPEHCPKCNHAMESILDYLYWHKFKRCTACRKVCECKKPALMTDDTYCFGCHRPTKAAYTEEDRADG